MNELHFDIQESCSQLKIDQNIYLRILDKAIAQTTSDIAQLRESLAQADVDKVQAISHRLKGDYANLYIQELSTLAKEMNDISRTNKDFQHMQKIFTEFSGRFELLRALVNKLKQP